MKKLIIILFFFAFSQSYYCYAQKNKVNNNQEKIENQEYLHNQTLRQISDLQETVSYQKTLIIVILIIVTIVLIYFMLKLYSLNNLQRKLNIRHSQFRREKQELESTIIETKKENESFKNAINELSEGLIITDNNFDINYVNNKVCSFLNCTSDKIIDKNLFNLFDDRITGIIKDNLSEIKGKTKLSFDIEINSNHTFKFSAKKIIQNDTNTFAWIIDIMDISEITQAMNTIYDSEEKFYNIINNSNDGVVLVNDKGKIIEWNSGLTKMTGFDKSEVLNEYFWYIQDKLLRSKTINQNNKQQKTEYFNDIIANGVPENHSRKDRKIFNKNGKEIYINENIFTFELNNSKVLCAIIRDVTAKKKIEKELEFNFNRFRELAELSPEAIFETNREGLITYLNPIGYTKLGFEKKNPGINIFSLELFSRQDLSRLKKDLFQLIKNNKDIGIKEYKLLTKDKKEIPIYLHLQLIKKENKIIGFRGMAFDISEQKKLMKNLKENEEKYRSLFEKAPYGLSLIRIKDSQILDLNQVICKRFNLNKKHAIGMTVEEAGLFFDEEVSLKMNNELKSKGYFKDISFEVREKDGKISTFSSSGNLITINDTPCVMIFTIDISERIKIQEELVRNEEKYRTIFKLTPGVVCLLDSSGKIIDISNKVKDYLGYASDELINKDFSNFGFIEKKSLELLKKNFAKRMLGKKIPPYEIKLIHKDGSIRYGLLLGDVEMGKDGLPIQDVVIIVDITERLKIKEKLEERTHLLKSIMDLSPMIITITDLKKDKNIWCNKAVESELGYSREEYQNISHNDIMKLIDPESIKTDSLKESFNKDILEKGFWESELRIKDKNGNWKWFYNKSKPFKVNNDGNIEQVLKVSINIDKIKKVEKELAEINRTKDKFFSIIAHDLRSPISSFLGLSQMLYDNYENIGINDLADSLKGLFESAGVLYNLMENLLNWARIQTKHIEFNPTEINLSDILSKDIEIFNEISKKKNLKIINSIEDNLIMNADYNMIYTITRNLISNAIKFTNHNGSIVISAKETENEFEISVSDTGVGMDKDTLDRLFKVDQINSTPGTDNEKGTGMGLIICREFVEYHKGRIWVESEIDKGSVFTFTIGKNLVNSN